MDFPDRIERTALGAVTIGRLIEVRFENRAEHQRRRGLDYPVADSRNTERALAHATGLGNHHPSNWLRSVASCSNLLPQCAEPPLHPARVDAREGLPVHAGRAAVRTAPGIRVSEDVFTPHFVIQAVEPPRRLLLGLHVQRPLEPPNLFRSCQAHANLLVSARSSAPPNQGSFPPLALPRFIGRMSPSDVCRTRFPMEPLSGDPDRPTDLPCCKSPRAYVLRPLPRRAGPLSHVGGLSRPRRPSSMEMRLGARIIAFEACSGFTRVAARTLAGPPKAGVCPQGFDGSVTLPTSRVATKAYRHLLGPDSHRLR